MKVIIAPDSYKGCLDAEAVARSIASGLVSTHPQADIEIIPLADGGEGTATILARALGANIVSCPALDPLGRPIEGYYYRKDDLAIADVATASGLALLLPDERNPLRADSRGTGMIIGKAIADGCRRVWLGLGGSATVDGGAGLTKALGSHDEQPRGIEYSLLCDVNTPLLGNNGAAAVFGPQKGADTPDKVAQLEKRLSLIAETTGGDTSEPGSGAAGGIGFMIKHIARLSGGKATFYRGADFVLDALDFDRRIANADIVITGEGHSDRQTLMGKLPSAVLKRCLAAGVPTMLISGGISDKRELRAAGFAEVHAATPSEMPINEAMQPLTAAANIAKAAAQLSTRW